MPQNGSKDQANNAPTFNIDDKNTKGTAAYGTTVFGVDALEVGVSKKLAHTGWVKLTRGKGALKTITVGAGGSGYTNGAAWSITAPAGGTNATGTITVTTGAITGFVVTSLGSGFFGSETVTLPAGSGGTAVLTYDGRAGRQQSEVLVAITMTGTDGSDDATFPDA